jgi:hypothetical protein
MAMTSDWEIKSRAHCCAKSQKPFEDGEAIYTVLFRDKSGFRREDVSSAAWQEIKDSFGEKAPFSFWKSKYEAPPPPVPEPIQKESVEELLRRLIEEDKHTPARFVLAVMLERKKILKQVDVKDSGEERFLVYEHGKSGEVFVIPDPQLKLSEIELVQGEIYDLLNPPAPLEPETLSEPANAAVSNSDEHQ